MTFQMTHLFRLGFICEGSGELSCDDSNVDSPNTKEQNLQSPNLQENQASPNAEVLWYSFVSGFNLIDLSRVCMAFGIPQQPKQCFPPALVLPCQRAQN